MNKFGVGLAATLLAASALAQEAIRQPVSSASSDSSPALQSSSVALAPKTPASEGPDAARTLPTAGIRSAPAAELFDGDEAAIKFNLNSLMRVLRDSRHEGWVLAAYPDPKTSRPLIGAGFSLDVEATEHAQRDPLNPHSFIEPSSAQLWQAAGLDPERLQSILEQYDRDLNAWKKKAYRKKIRAHTLTPQITEDEATLLLRISAVQAIHNARAYCRNFDQLNAPQQMALSQLVFQMGVNLEEFVQFLTALNGDDNDARLQTASLSTSTASDRGHWSTVERTLIESQWAKRYTSRAVSVIAMFDPDYLADPAAAERRVQYAIRPPRKHRHKSRRA